MLINGLVPWLKRQFQRLNFCDVPLAPKLRKELQRNHDQTLPRFVIEGHSCQQVIQGELQKWLSQLGFIAAEMKPRRLS